MSATFYALVDWHASRIMNSIKNLVAEDASVIRDGKHQTVPARDLVVGDVVTLTMGDRVPADLRLVTVSSDVRFDRSLLTGERCGRIPRTFFLPQLVAQRLVVTAT